MRKQIENWGWGRVEGGESQTEILSKKGDEGRV